MRVDQESLERAVDAYEKMTLKEQESVADRIYLSQPNLLASALVLQRFGNSMEHIGEILKILIVLQLALEFKGVKIASVSEQEQDRELNRLVATIKFSEDLSAQLQSKSIQNYIEHHKEKYALAFAYNTMSTAGIFALKEENSKFLVMAGLNLVNCIANAKDA